MEAFKWAHVALLLAEEDRYAPYYKEALDHAGLRHEVIQRPALADLGRIDVLLLAGYGSLSEAYSTAIAAWVRQGGVLVCSGGTWDLGPLLGLAEPFRHCTNEVIYPAGEHRQWSSGAPHARFFGGEVTNVAGSQPIASTKDGKIAIGKKKAGKGFAYFVGPHVGQTIALMQLGHSVECDGIGPSDGSARLDDGLLRAEDGTNLDFREDRLEIEGCAPFFAYPHADVIREIWIRTILAATDDAGSSALLTWHWPRGSEATAMLSLDCESFDAERVHKVHRLLSMYGSRAVWMIALPGYPLDVYRALRSWEHEVGLIFVTDDAGGWHEEKLKIQHVAVSRNAAAPAMVSARPLDGKWRGYVNFYDLAENGGARLSLSKGGRQPGTSGFLFGTSHPFFPIKRDGAAYLVAELPYAAYMPGEVTADRVCDAILSETISRYGCFHVALRPEAVDCQEAFSSLRRLLAECKLRKVASILPEELYRFEKGRRGLRLISRIIGEEGQIQVASDTKLEGLFIMATGPPCEALIKGKAAQLTKVERYGATFHCLQLDLEPKQQVEIQLVPISAARLAA